VHPFNGPATFVLAVVIAGYDFQRDNGIHFDSLDRRLSFTGMLHADGDLT